MKYSVENSGSKIRHLGGSSPKECLERSRYTVARLLRHGDLIGGLQVTSKIVDPDDGEIVFALDDGSWVAVESP